MTKEYNKKVKDIFGPRSQSGEVGIEIEMEGNRLIPDNILPWWIYHRDHSLRGAENAEYVLAKPIKRGEVKAAVDELFTMLDRNKAKIRQNSPNASVHVHLNVQDWTLKQTYVLICLWYIFEEVLMDWCGEQRVGNLFCLRASDAEAQLLKLASAVRYGRYSDLNDQDGLRYSAMNFTALGKFGSLEFRGYPALYESEKIQLWVKALLALKDFAEKYPNPPDIIMEFSRSGPEDFFKLVLKDDLWKEFRTANYQQQLRTGMRLIQNVAYCVNWEATAPEKKKDPSEPDLELGGEFDDVVFDEDNDAPRRGRRVEVPQMRIQMPMPGADWRQVNPFIRDIDAPVPEPEVPQPAPDHPPQVPADRPGYYGFVHGVHRFEGAQWMHGGNLYRIRNVELQMWHAGLVDWIPV